MRFRAIKKLLKPKFPSVSKRKVYYMLLVASVKILAAMLLIWSTNYQFDSSPRSLPEDDVTNASKAPPHASWLFFNRLPRTGGSVLVALLKRLSEDNDFTHHEHNYRSPWQRLLSSAEQRGIATMFEYSQGKTSYDRLALFINFTEYSSGYLPARRPTLVTLLREPTAHFASQFYHRRHDRQMARRNIAVRERQQPGSGRRWFRRSLEACILEGDEECALMQGQSDFQRATPFLCGQQPECLVLGSEVGLQRASQALESHYSVVGVLEMLNITLAVLEHSIPAFFGGAQKLYWGDDFKASRNLNSNPRVSPVLSTKATILLKSKLRSEYALYDLAVKKLKVLYACAIFK